LAEYRRFISYIYQYEKDEKGINAGFAKVETRSGVCRMVVHIRGVFLGQNETCTIWGLVEEGKKMRGIPLGECKPSNGIIDHKIVTPSENMGDTSYTFSQIAGILIDTGREKVYGTMWEENRRLRPGKVVTSWEEEKEEELHAAEGSAAVSIPEEITEHMSIEAIQKELGMTKKKVCEYCAECPFDSKAEVKEGSNVIDLQAFKASLKKESLGEERIELNYKKEEKELTSDAKEEEIKEVENNQTYGENIGLLKEKKVIKELRRENELQEECLLREDGEETEDSERLEHYAHEKIGKDMDPMEKWMKLQEYYKQVQPFQDQEIVECIQIEPKDLVHLKREDWILGNNSFLLHGYFNYRYLIMGRIVAAGESRFVLGVPGVYENQERVMANMFGFPSFKPANQTEVKPGEFGYWYRTVK
jgi:hypothetical protein